MAFETLNRLRWKGGIERCSVRIVHRGAPGDSREIPGGSITEIKKSYLSYSNDGRETTVPLHRITEILLDGKTLWKRNTRRG